MNKTKFMVFWIMEDGYCNAIPFYTHTDEGSAMDRALAKCQELRKNPNNRFVTMASESIENAGLAGVDEVKDGKTPDGENYTWSKAHRAGAVRGGSHSIIDNKSNQ